MTGEQDLQPRIWGKIWFRTRNCKYTAHYQVPNSNRL